MVLSFSAGISAATMTPQGTWLLTQLFQNVEPALRARRARLELARELAVEGADRHEDLDQILLRHRPEQVEVALDQRRLGDDGDRVIALGQHFEDAAGDPVLALDRLVAVGVGAERDRAGLVAAACASSSRSSSAALVLANSLVSKSSPGDSSR